MTATSWMRYPNTRYGRFQKGRYPNKEDEITIDVNSDARENVRNILSELCHVSDMSDGKRLNYLNAFVKVTLHIEGNFESIGFNMKDILCCLRIALLHDSTQVRSGGLRAIRHVLRNEDDISQLNKLLIPFLIARSLDLVLKNDVERIEAMKLMRKILLLSPSNFHLALGRSLVALANGGVEEKDRLLRICLATLCELGVVNTQVFIETGGVAAVTRNLLECQTPKIAESLCGVLLLLLDKPTTRNQAGVDLHSIAAPYCDFHYRHGWKDKDKYVDERELRFNCSRLALLSILRSWPGILHFCGPSNKAGLRAVVEVLYLNQLEVRKAVLDLLYELLGLPQPEWTDELSVALSAVDPCEPQSSWRLNEGFVAAEGRSILPHLAKTTPSIIDMHLALLLYCFLECGLLGAIVEVIATSDTFISVRATVLLGELLHLIQLLLPPECCNISPALPSLLEYATCGNPQAVKAVNGLQQLQKLLRARPASYSLYLDFILRSGGNVKFSSKYSKKTRHKLKSLKFKLQQLVGKDGDDVIKETGVLLNKDPYTWNWNLIRIVLKGDCLKLDLADTTNRNFFKRLIDFYTPSRNRYSHMDLSSTKLSTAYTLTGVDLINCLLEIDDDESNRMLRELLTDISGHITAITSGRSVHDCLFSPQHMNSTQCQSYFLFLGRLSSTEAGIQLLNTLQMFKKLEHLATTTNNDCYIKLIVSSLDYSNAPCRDLLDAVLKCPVESSRLYATHFLLVLLRAGISNFSDWGVKFLVNQLKDKSRSVFLTALNILHEACELQTCLETLVKLNPNFTHMGEKGALLTVRLMSVVSGFQLLNKNDFLISEIKRWDDFFNCRYIKLVEGEASDVLTLHQRDEDGKYDKRTSAIRNVNRKDFFLPPHIYGQLARHTDGFLMLVQHGSLEIMLQTLTNAACDSEDEIIKLKGTLWALGHFGSTNEGLRYLILHNCLAAMILLAQECLVFSIRATSYYCLGLIATTRLGADELFKLGWFCTRHNRHISWPIIEEEAWEDEPEDSIRLQCNFPDISSTFYFFDSGIKDVEGSTDDDTSESLVALPDSILAGHQKSLTLPANQNQPSGYHKRSLSESKTFEIIRAPADCKKGSFRLGTEIVRRVRNNSTTESTTSGVSSCDSVGGGRSVVYERQQLLSPIPSSCSLSTLKQTGKIRRHSESSRRVSIQSGSNSDKSLQSLIGGASGKLSHQDLVGYATLRALRKSPRYLEEPAYDADEITNESAWDVPISLIEDYNLIENTFLSIKRFSVHDGSDNEEDRCYMGITLPNEIHNLFLDVEEEIKDASLEMEKFPIINDEIVYAMHDFKVKEETIWKHDTDSCLRCSGKVDKPEEVFVGVPGDCLDAKYDPNSPEGVVKAHVLRLVDQFSNPVWCKQVKQSLLHCKQGSPQVFQDVCLYSEISKMLTECTYRLSPRRMLHELFLEVKSDDLHEQCANILKNAQNEVDSGKSSGDSIDNSEVAQPSNIKKLDSLKLAYKENKFPIRNRNESKIV